MSRECQISRLNPFQEELSMMEDDDRQDLKNLHDQIGGQKINDNSSINMSMMSAFELGSIN
jgi:hypothetical protein